MYNKDKNQNQYKNPNPNWNQNQNRNQKPNWNQNGGAPKKASITLVDVEKEFKPKWITDEIDEACMNLCDELSKNLVTVKVSSSFLRNIFGELRRIEIGGYESHKADFVLLRPKFAYACARAVNNSHNDDLKGAIDNLRQLYDKAAREVSNAHGFRNLVNIMEAIVAFHKANGGDNQ